MNVLLKEMKAEGTVHEKVKAYNDANRKVAILCNHKRTVAASHAGQMEKMSERVSLCSVMFFFSMTLLISISPPRSKVYVTRNGGSSK